MGCRERACSPLLDIMCIIGELWWVGGRGVFLRGDGGVGVGVVACGGVLSCCLFRGCRLFVRVLALSFWVAGRRGWSGWRVGLLVGSAGCERFSVVAFGVLWSTPGVCRLAPGFMHKLCYA